MKIQKINENRDFIGTFINNDFLTENNDEKNYFIYKSNKSVKPKLIVGKFVNW